MDMTETFLQNNSLSDPDDIDSLVALSSLVRSLIAAQEYEQLNQIIRYTVENSCFEAFSWCMWLLQEALVREDGISSFDCPLGRSIPNYDEFLSRLQTDLSACTNELETVYDKTGEVQSIDNILVYRTGYQNIYLISSENFDTADHDFIRYKLSFTRA